MRNYEKPLAKVCRFEVEDIMLSSGMAHDTSRDGLYVEDGNNGTGSGTGIVEGTVQRDTVYFEW